MDLVGWQFFIATNETSVDNQSADTLSASSRLSFSHVNRVPGVATLGLVFSLLLYVELPVHGDPPQPASAVGSARVVELRINDEINPVMAEYIDGGIDQANRENAALILITMDTPGGL